jgi:hypothetical protein
MAKKKKPTGKKPVKGKKGKKQPLAAPANKITNL